MFTIDGSYGEGGGQILRTAMGLAAIAGKPVVINNIRAGRRKPGLQRQHLCAVQAVRRVCDGTLTGDSLGSGEILFEPGITRGGDFDFEIGSAGSVTLVAQSVLIPLLRCRDHCRIRVRGGTHNPHAPPYDFFERVYLPCLRRMGLEIQSGLLQHGLYPKGGGEIEFSLSPPSHLTGFDYRQRGKLKSASVWAMVARLPKHIAVREVDLIRRRSQWPNCETHVVEIENDTGPGNVVLIELEFEDCREIVVEFGERGVRAEQVAARALRQAKMFIQNDVPVGEHLADQLLLPAAIAAEFFGETSRFVTGKLSMHATTHIWLLEQLLDVRVELQSLDDTDRWQVTVQTSQNQ